jgi:hypothetical protein
MNLELRMWLARCPYLRRVSVLVLDAHRCGLIQLQRDIPEAVLASARRLTYPAVRLQRDSALTERRAELMSRRARYGKVRIDHDTAVLEARIGRGVCLIQTCDKAVIHCRGQLPQSIITAARGCAVSTFVKHPLLSGRPYVVTSASANETGFCIWFDVPSQRATSERWLAIASGGSGASLDDRGIRIDADE